MVDNIIITWNPVHLARHEVSRRVEKVGGYEKINLLTYDKTCKNFNVQYLLGQSSISQLDDHVIRTTFWEGRSDHTPLK